MPRLPEPRSMSYAYYNPNPAGRSVGDCAVRAQSKALGQTWEETYAGLALEGFIRGDLPNADSVWGPYLRKHGFTRYLLPDSCPDCYTVADFSTDHPRGTFILSMPGRQGHPGCSDCPAERIAAQAAQIQALQLSDSQAQQNATLMVAMDANKAEILAGLVRSAPPPPTSSSPLRPSISPPTAAGSLRAGAATAATRAAAPVAPGA